MVRRFLPQDLREVNAWYAARGFPQLTERHLPRVGFIVPGVAAGFLYQTDAPAIAMLEGYVSRPRAGVRLVSSAIDDITGALLAEAKLRGVSSVVALTHARGIERRANKFGMRTIGVYAMAAKELA